MAVLNFTLVYSDGTEDKTRGLSYKAISELYLNQVVRTETGLKLCVRVIHPTVFSIIDILESQDLVDEFARELVFYLPESDIKGYLLDKQTASDSITGLKK